MNKVFMFLPNKGFNCGCILIAAKSRNKALLYLIKLVNESEYYQEYFDMDALDYFTEEWEKSDDNNFGVYYVKELKDVISQKEGFIESNLYERDL